jgi:hypothetical protein
METKELFEKVIQFHTKKENFLHPLKEKGYEKEFIDKVDRILDLHYDKWEYVTHLDSYGEMVSGGNGYFFTYNIPVSNSVSVDGGIMFHIPDDLTIRKMKIDRIMNSDFSRKQS